MQKEKPQIQQQFELYLEKMNLKQSEMPDVQYIELRRAFYAGFGQLLALFLFEISEMSEDDSVNALDQLFTETQEFFSKEENI